MPWMYLRLFGILLLMAAVCLACIWLDIGALPAPYIYAFFWCGALLPLTLAMFLWELDPFVNISIFEMMGLALLSGVVCVLFGTPVDNSIISGYFAPVWGYVKDSVLMLGVLILVLVCTRKRMYGLGGLAFGAAIGAGYALFTMLMASIVDTPIVETPTGLARDFSGLTNAISASVPMLFGNHALWFAPVAGALGLRMSGEKINIRHFADVRVILLILLGFAENYLMNSAKSPFGWTFLNADLIALTRTDAIEVKHVIVLAIGMAFATSSVRNSLMSYTAYFAVIAGIMLVALLIFRLTVNEPKFVTEMQADSKRFGIDNGDDDAPAGSGKLGKAERRSLIFLLLSIVLWFFGYNAVTSKYSVYASNILHKDYNLTLMLAQAAAIVAYLPVGIVASKIGRKKTILGGVVMLAVAFGVAAFLNAESPTMLMNAMFCLAGIGWATINVNSFPMVVEMCSGSDVGRYTGFYYTASMAAQVVTPMFSGFLMDKLGMTVLFPYATIFVAGAFVTMLFVRHGDSRPIPAKGLEALDVDD